MDLELSLSTKTEDLPDFMRAEAPDAGRLQNEEGLFQPPFLKILQGLSGEVAARLGMIGDIWSGAHERIVGGPGKPVYLIPVAVQRKWTLFDGKQFQWNANSESEAADKLVESLRINPSLKAREAYQTARLNVMVMAPVRPDFHDCKPMILSFHGKAHKIGSAWYKQFTNQSAVKFNVPYYGQVWAMDVAARNEPTGDWSAPAMSFAGVIKDKMAFLASKAMFEHFEKAKWGGQDESE